VGLSLRALPHNVAFVLQLMTAEPACDCEDVGEQRRGVRIETNKHKLSILRPLQA
jgi:hypothetical protein